ncbi:MAG: bifunctional aspartate kinase/homoserine dehydrogenase I [Bacteroidota bacterium]
MKVLKFGGSSVASPERIKGVIDILKGYYSKGEKFTVVFSAFGGVTDMLIDMSQAAAKGDLAYQDAFNEFSKRHMEAVDALLEEAERDLLKKKIVENHEVLKNLLHGIYLVREASPRTMDYVLSFGERNSAFIISEAMKQSGINAHYLDARQIISTDKNFGAANVRFEESYKNIRQYYGQQAGIHVATGFISADKGGLTTTLGRGGSDYTASLLAAGLDASQIEIWTDVDGVLTADPRRVSKAFTIPSMTYAEAMEMSHFGAKVIYPPTLLPALNKLIPLRIKNTFNPDFEGTYITNQTNDQEPPVKGISSISEIALLTVQGSGLFGVPGIAARLFNCLAAADINIILITQGSSEHSISFAVQPKLAAKARKKVEKEFEYELQTKNVDPIKVEEDLSVVAIIGENMRYQPGIAGRLFQALGKNGINCVAIAQGSSELNVSVVINRSDERKALNSLHESFFLSDTQEIHLFMIGVGLIGSTLIEQIGEQAAYLKEKHQMEIRIVGLANSRKMLFQAEGVSLENWKEELLDSEEDMQLGTFIDKMKSLNLPNSIFVDNTASKSVSDCYENILDASISISTPNKIATSSSYLQYQRLKSIANRRAIPFHYETNVGAGLPVISTLVDLIDSGDRILKIEGVLSGSLSFIFNSFAKGVKFSEIVRKAQELGYTEPDPRIDLNGIDVRRKLIILSRETGLSTEAKDVTIENILPEACQSAETVDAFFEAVADNDDHFENLRASAEQEGKVLRMIATLDHGKASIGLQAVDQQHPFYTLSGSDNMIVFTTERYKERPLVVRGPGAGAEVTAAGVFAEIIKIANYLS